MAQMAKEKSQLDLEVTNCKKSMMQFEKEKDSEAEHKLVEAENRLAENAVYFKYCYFLYFCFLILFFCLFP
jgi:hypothetical protein